MTEKEAIENSKQHWKNMIEYGKRQPPCEIISHYGFDEMKIAIGERPGADCCALCHLFLNVYDENICSDCPLYKKGFNCDTYNSPYSKVMRSGNWGKFVAAAENMLKILESL